MLWRIAYCLLIAAGPAAMLAGSAITWDSAVARLVFSAAALAVPAILLPLGAYLYLLLPVALAGYGFAGYQLVFNKAPTADALFAVLQTNIIELNEMSSAFGLKGVVAVIAALLLVYVLVAWRIRAKLGLKAVVAVLPALVLFPSYSTELINSYPVGVLAYVAAAGPTAWQTVRGETAPKRAYGAKPLHRSDEVHVLVIGESMRYDALHLNGYHRETTPNLDKLDLVSFSESWGSANLTQLAVPMVLSGFAPEEYGVDRLHGSILDAAKEAGFRTAFLGNQHPMMVRPVSPGPDKLFFTLDVSDRLADVWMQKDEKLLPHFKDFVQQPGPLFIVVHLNGSHFDYFRRYPDAFAKWEVPQAVRDATFFNGGNTREFDQGMRNGYDNSILYTDWVLQQIVEQLKASGRPTTLTLTSDHAEAFSTTDGKRGHGTIRAVAGELHVPLLIWFSESYRRQHPDIVAAVKANAGRRHTNDVVFHTIADLAGISFPEHKPDRSLATREFKERPLTFLLENEWHTCADVSGCSLHALASAKAARAALDDF